MTTQKRPTYDKRRRIIAAVKSGTVSKLRPHWSGLSLKQLGRAEYNAQWRKLRRERGIL
jgi:hypothetical protein